jgi:hypothetical protein
VDTPLDYRALDTVPDRDNVRTYREFNRSIGVTGDDGLRQEFRVSALLVGMVLFTPGSVAVAVFTLFSGELNAGTVLASVFWLAIAAGGFIYLARVRLPRWGSRLWRERLMVSRFAEENGASYEPNTERMPPSGLIFGQGHDRRITDRVSFSAEPRFEVGNLHYRVNLPRNSVIDYHWGYIRIPLERHFPHTVLDSTSNNGLRGAALPARLRNRGEIELEGDFSEFFVLTVPQGYERDALYLLTPDLMLMLIEEGADLDIEIIDDILFVYRPRIFRLSSAEEWRRIERIVDTIGERTQHRTARYGDERTGDRLADRVAPEGRRIAAPRITLAAVVALITVVVGLFAALMTAGR